MSRDDCGQCDWFGGAKVPLCEAVGVGGSVLVSGCRGSAATVAGVLTAFVVRPAALLRTARPRSAIVPADHHALRRRSRRRTHCFNSSVARLTCTLRRRERKWRYTTLRATPRAYGTMGRGGSSSGDSALRRWMTRVADRLWRT